MITVAIASAENVEPADGVHALIEVSGVVESLAFYAAQVPDFGEAKLVPHMAQGSLYRVRSAHAGLWYFWAIDLDNLAEPPGEGMPVWIGLSEDEDTNLVGLHLRDVLIANQKALEKALRAKWHEQVTIDHIVYGTAAAIQSFPAILVTKPRESSSYVVAPYIREHRYSFDIYVFIAHQDGYSHLNLSVLLAGKCREILNLPQNDTFRLASGTEIAFAQCTEGESDDSEIGEDIWAAVGSVIWSGTALKQSTGGA